ncbi:MAG TPA: PepSY-associated TM helix domain-containing protein [Pirellulaceae bacterium]|nr:PepSY-associated TM helix domain-containing protein [Pirellulaceae bacterium]
MSPPLSRVSRKLHRWGAIIILIPVGLVIVTGLLLQVKKQFAWVQPPTQRGTGTTPVIDWPQLLEIARSVPEANVREWRDFDRIDVQPKRGIAKLICQNRWELQINMANGEVLSSTYRRSDLIESLHDGTFFGDWAKLWVFLPNGLILLVLWLTGAYLWILPVWVRANKKRKRMKKT